MVPQYYSYGSAGVPVVPATIFMSKPSMLHHLQKPKIAARGTKVGQYRLEMGIPLG